MGDSKASQRREGSEVRPSPTVSDGKRRHLDVVRNLFHKPDVVEAAQGEGSTIQGSDHHRLVSRSSDTSTSRYRGMVSRLERLWKRKQDHDGFRETAGEPGRYQDLDQLKQQMSPVFRQGGYIQLLSEEKFTFASLDRTAGNPELRHAFMDMLQSDIPEHHPLSAAYNGDLYRTRVQTARALQYAHDYLDATVVAKASSRSLDSRGVHVTIARETIKKVGGMKDVILEDPDRIIFLGTDNRNRSREDGIRIDAGKRAPQQDWTSREATESRVKIEEDVGFKIMEQVRPFVSGDQFEKDTTAVKKHKLEKSYWQNKDRDWRLPVDDRTDYYDRIHPAIARYTQSAIEHLVQQGKKEVTILDIAGGNGDLAERVIKNTQARFPDVSIAYRLIDYVQDDVDLANERFNSLRSNNVTALAEQRDMFKYGFNSESVKKDKDLHLPQEGADIVISSGGLLNNSITGETEVAGAFNRMYTNLVRPGGFIVASGLSPLLINSTHHHANDVDIQNLYDMDNEVQMHVVRRRTHFIDDVSSKKSP